ncbi:MAG: phenylacetate--CoA ligase family protein, partial [Deltaproteobacteria bacterium]|nr:phenylacetate--CoA ligase family protein [Deltaproteobacteria bacterium]
MTPQRWALLRGAVERARKSAWYARTLAAAPLEDPADFATLPFTRKQDVMEASPFGMLAVPPAHAWHYHESSGTTGKPVATWCGLTELTRMASIVTDAVPELGADEAMLLNRFPSFAPVHFLMEEVLRRTGRCHIAAGSMSWDVPFGRALEFMRQLPVSVLATLPFEMVLLREAGRELGIDVVRECKSLKAVLLGGAVLPPAFKKWIADAWQVRVVEIYGSNETMLLAIGCTEGGLHLATDLFEHELLDPATMTPVPAGSPGVLTITSLVHEVMPLVRYVTGDLVEMSSMPCPCGRSAPTIRVLGRATEMIEMRGRVITPADLVDACYEFVASVGARVFFVVILKRGIEVLVETTPEKPATTALEEVRLANRLGVPVTVRWLPDGDVFDRAALFRTPKIYKPGQVSDWRGEGRKTLTVMEALLEWPKF